MNINHWDDIISRAKYFNVVLVVERHLEDVMQEILLTTVSNTWTNYEGPQVIGMSFLCIDNFLLQIHVLHVAHMGSALAVILFRVICIIIKIGSVNEQMFIRTYRYNST